MLMLLDPHAVVAAMNELQEQYMQVPRTCFTCRNAPAVAPIAFVLEDDDPDRMEGCIVAVCVVCLTSEDLQELVREAVKKEVCEQEMAPWN
jgi:hypothetical protein